MSFGCTEAIDKIMYLTHPLRLLVTGVQTFGKTDISQVYFPSLFRVPGIDRASLSMKHE